MTKKLCDLHTHSYYSDGTSSPALLIDEAARLGLSAVALCDHDTCDGLPEFFSHAKDSSVEAIGGIEFSTSYRDKELHILALFVREEHFDRIAKITDTVRRRKEESNQRLVASLNAAGYEIDYGEIRKANKGSVNRAHIASALVAGGYAKSVKEAFSEILAESKGFYVPPKRFDALEIIELIRDMGAVSVLAHPFLNLNEDELRVFLSLAIPCGLCAMETRYSTYSEKETLLADEIAGEYGLLGSGGSDFHGERKPDISIGSGKGGLEVPASFVDGLRPENNK